MDKNLILSELARAVNIDTKQARLQEGLVALVNDLLRSDFERLVSLLYRLDIDEQHLKQTLRDNPDTDAAVLIVDMMIERQAQKIESRQQYNQRDNNISEDEKW